MYTKHTTHIENPNLTSGTIPNSQKAFIGVIDGNRIIYNDAFWTTVSNFIEKHEIHS